MRWRGFLLFLLGAAALGAAEPIRPKVVIVAMFERGADRGDAPGELQLWVEREKLDRVVPLPAGFHDVLANADGSVIAIVTGVGNTRAAATVMAVGLDPRFDLRRSYWLVAGIAGVDPADGTLASAAWVEWIVNGDLRHEIDPRETPQDWNTGRVPLRRTRPYEAPRDQGDGSHVFRLDPGLVAWAYALTKDVAIPDTAELAAYRARYRGFPNAQRPPSVMKGDTVAAETYWHGRRLNQWANEWMRYYSDGRGNYVMTAMEDTGTLQSLTWLARAGRVDVRRALVLRTASNFDFAPPGMAETDSLFGKHVPLLPALEAAYLVGIPVVRELTANWSRYEGQIPGAR